MERSRQKSEESIASFHQSAISENKQSIDQKSNNEIVPPKQLETMIQDQQAQSKEADLNKNVASYIPTAAIPTIQPDMPRRGRRAGMPPPEEKKDDENQIRFGGRRLGQNRM